jgi:hypothetical protein
MLAPAERGDPSVVRWVMSTGPQIALGEGSQLAQAADEGQLLRREPPRERARAHAKLTGNLVRSRLSMRSRA